MSRREARLDRFALTQRMRQWGGVAYAGQLRASLRDRGALGTGAAFERRFAAARRSLEATGQLVEVEVEPDGEELLRLVERGT